MRINLALDENVSDNPGGPRCLKYIIPSLKSFLNSVPALKVVCNATLTAVWISILWRHHNDARRDRCLQLTRQVIHHSTHA